MPYTNADAVQALIARLFQTGFSASTTPTSTQTDVLIASVSAEVEVRLVSNGFTVPATTPAYFVTWIGQTVAYGVAAIVLKSAYPESVTSENGGPVIPSYAFYEKKYQDNLKLLDSGDLTIITAEGGEPIVGPSSYFTENPDVEVNLGEIAEPPFKMSKVF